MIDKYKREAISLYAGELRNATLWNWESNEEIKKRTGVRTKTIKEILKDNSLFYKYSHFFFRNDLFGEITILLITVLNLFRIIFWKNELLEKVWSYFFI